MIIGALIKTNFNLHALQPLPKSLFEYIIFVLFPALLKKWKHGFEIYFLPICKSFKCWHLPSRYDFAQTLIEFAFERHPPVMGRLSLKFSG